MVTEFRLVCVMAHIRLAIRILHHHTFDLLRATQLLGRSLVSKKIRHKRLLLFSQVISDGPVPFYFRQESVRALLLSLLRLQFRQKGDLCRFHKHT